MDDIIQETQHNNIQLTVIPLNNNLKVSLIRAFEIDIKDKKYLRNMCLLVNNELITTNFTDTVQFIEELAMFDTGNSQNSFFEIKEINKVRNLKLINTESNIFISKSVAKAIVKIYNMSYLGYSNSRLLEFPLIFSPDNLTQLMYQSKLLSK